MPDTEPTIALPQGFVIDKYRVIRALGQGGFGVVYEAAHEHLRGRRVAIKEYLPQGLVYRQGSAVRARTECGKDVDCAAEYARGLEHFKAEANHLVDLDHPNIVDCLDFVAANGTAYLIMKYEDGMPLGDLLAMREKRGAPFDEQDIMQVMLPALAGLSAAHAAGILHRDLKPDNIFIRRKDGQPLLLDFGAAKADYTAGGRTRESSRVFTAGYAAMEQQSGGGLGRTGPWTDIYAMGAVMWRAIAGEHPPPVQDRLIAERRGQDALAAAAQVGAGRFSPGLLAVVDKCLSLDMENRYQTVAELQAALEAVAQGAAAPPPADAAAVRAPPGAQSNRAQSVYRRGADGRVTRGPAPSEAPLTSLSSANAGEGDGGVAPDSQEAPARRKGGLLPWVFAFAALAVAAAGGGVWFTTVYMPAAELQRQMEARQAEAERKLAEEQARLAESRRRQAEREQAAEAQARRKAAEAQAQAQAAEQSRRQAEESARRQAEQARLAELERREEARRIEEEVARRVAEAEAQAQAEEAARQAEQKRREEARRKIEQLTRAAEKGDAGAQFDLAEKYRKGDGVDKDHKRAFHWHRQAAEQGHAAAQFKLAEMYKKGQGVKKDYGDALKWYRKAAKQGFKDAKKALRGF